MFCEGAKCVVRDRALGGVLLDETVSPAKIVHDFALGGAATAGSSRPSSTAAPVKCERIFPSMAVEEWVLRVRVSFATLDQGTCTAAADAFANAAIFSTRESRTGER